MKTIFSASTFLAVLSLSALAADPVAPTPAVQAVQAFYQYHFHHGMGFSEAGLKAREKWIDPSLYEPLMKEAKKPSSPDEVPDIDGDPFTNSQEYPNAIKVTKATETGDTANVDVVFQWPKGGNPPRPATIQLRKDAKSGAWRISNIVSDGDDLAVDLKKFLSNK